MTLLRNKSFDHVYLCGQVNECIMCAAQLFSGRTSERVCDTRGLLTKQSCRRREILSPAISPLLPEAKRTQGTLRRLRNETPGQGAAPQDKEAADTEDTAAGRPEKHAHPCHAFSPSKTEMPRLASASRGKIATPL